ncbi:MAG: hypothetical protein HY778_15930 [Betaproteobacteria bacterium]|nr:hypothetical protein [Betaproteobacteria bacterium]
MQAGRDGIHPRRRVRRAAAQQQDAQPRVRRLAALQAPKQTLECVRELLGVVEDEQGALRAATVGDALARIGQQTGFPALAAQPLRQVEGQAWMTPLPTSPQLPRSTTAPAVSSTRAPAPNRRSMKPGIILDSSVERARVWACRVGWQGATRPRGRPPL